MRTILKRAEPSSLTEYRHIPGANYEDYHDKDTLRRYLVEEQRGLCCYCMGPIRPDRDAMRIEHWLAQSSDGGSEHQLDYNNLLGSCKGNEGSLAQHHHCDKAKGNSHLSRNPADPMHHVEDVIRFLGDGKIVSNDQAWDGELNNVLRLNLPLLTNRRKALLMAFQKGLEKRGPLRRADLEKWLRDWNGESGPGNLQPYCQVVVYWLRKRLTRGM